MKFRLSPASAAFLLFLFALLACFRGAPRPSESVQAAAPQQAAGKNQPAAKNPASGDAERERLLGIGKQIFVARCASCHNERGDKPLRTGLPLNERKLTREQIQRGAGGRLSGKSDEEKQAVALYIESFMKR